MHIVGWCTVHTASNTLACVEPEYIYMYVMYVCVCAARFQRTNYMAENWNGGYLLAAMTYGKHCMLICLENQSLNPMNMTLGSEFVQLGRIILLLFYLFSVTARTECFECRSVARQWKLTSCINTPVQAVNDVFCTACSRHLSCRNSNCPAIWGQRVETLAYLVPY